MTALAEEHSTPLRVGITQSVGIRALPDIVRRFGQEWPRVRIQPRESETDLELYGGVEQAELDLSFVELPAPPGPLQMLSLLVDPTCSWCAATHHSPIAQAAPPSSRSAAWT
jgi:DNA-binding transcriptional LysR family regulator